MRNINRALAAALTAGVATGLVLVAGAPASAEGTVVPEAPEFAARGEVSFVGRDDIQEFKALDGYSEPSWVTENFVNAGKLPPVEERLPEEPLVFKTGDMPDGTGVYGDTLRHVIGGRPEGWNWQAGQAQGWGGISYQMYECLTRTGPLFRVNADELEPLPNLARSWEWSEDGRELTMRLVEGVKWSDGDPFDAEDVMFYWDDHILDTNIAPQGGATRESFGANTTLEMVDPHTIKWTFEEEKPTGVLYEMAFGKFCPGPSHVMKPEHPKYSDNSYEDYKNAFPPEMVPWPVLGSHAPTLYRADDIIVMRRNPYYWKVDEAGNQLPYVDEVQYKLSTWSDRTVQAVAGSGDWSNMENANNYVAALQRSAEDDAPARLEFGPRIIGFNLEPNYATTGWGNPDERASRVRELNRNLDFRKAVTTAIDRQNLGQSLVKGPFTAIYPGGIYPDTIFYDRESTVYYPFDIDGAKASLEAAGLTDTDGDGIVNFEGGGNVEITLLVPNRDTERTLAEGVVAMMERLGLRVIPDIVDDNQFAAKRDGGQFDWMIRRGEKEFNTVIQDASRLAPIGPQTSWNHKAAGADGQVELMDFEGDLVDIVRKAIATNDNAERAELMKDFQKTFTQNVYGIGLANYPGALIVNKRFRNVTPGTPILAFQWAEDGAIRERMYVPEEEQGDFELQPGTLPHVE